MGCITTVGKIILIILNVVFLIVSLVLIAAGILLKFFASLIATLLLGTVGSLDSSTQSDFNIAGVEDIEELPFIGDVGLALIVFGAFLFVISFLACCCVCRGTLARQQAAEYGNIIILHSTIEDTLGDQVKTDFKEDGKDAFSVSINLLNYQGCYPKILDLALGNIVIAGVVLGLLLLLQVLEIVFAILVVLEESNKVGPM
nr:hypothetical protein BaRGS_020727 [Batillaria attramentaria]